MFFSVKTQVGQDFISVSKNFAQDLFLKLSPPFPLVKLLRYDGNEKGGEVHIELSFIFFKQIWVSLITESYIDRNEYYFIDEGLKVPFFLKYWHHKHRIVKSGSNSEIIDEVTFKTPFVLFDWLMFPVLYGQFLYRKPIYRKYFKL